MAESFTRWVPLYKSYIFLSFSKLSKFSPWGTVWCRIILSSYKKVISVLAKIVQIMKETALSPSLKRKLFGTSCLRLWYRLFLSFPGNAPRRDHAHWTTYAPHNHSTRSLMSLGALSRLSSVVRRCGCAGQGAGTALPSRQRCGRDYYSRHGSPGPRCNGQVV